MSPDEIFKLQFLEVVENQLKKNEPPETRQTLERLMQEGYPEEAAKLLISQCVAAEMIAMMDSDTPMNNERYIKWLHQLPDAPE